MALGSVKWFNKDKGFGFITSDGKDYFVHHKEIKGAGFKVLVEGQNVDFTPADGVKGAMASGVSVVKQLPTT